MGFLWSRSYGAASILKPVCPPFERVAYIAKGGVRGQILSIVWLVTDLDCPVQRAMVPLDRCHQILVYPLFIVRGINESGQDVNK